MECGMGNGDYDGRGICGICFGFVGIGSNNLPYAHLL